MSIATDAPRAKAPQTSSVERPLAIVSALAGVGAIAVSSCCALPIALAGVGIGTSWLGELEAFASYRPAILGIAVVALAIGWVTWLRRYRQAASCAVNGFCATPSRSWMTVGTLAIATAMVALAAAWNYLEGPLLAVLMQLQ